MFGIIISRIMTKSKKAELALNESQRNYKDLFDNANDAIFILDSKFNYTDVNQKAIDLFGFSREEFLQLNVRDIIPPEQYQKSDKEFAKLNKKGEYEKFIGRQRTKDGKWLDIEVSASAIIKNGKVIGSRDIVRDITARKREEEKKEKLIVELQNALAEIKTLRGILPICSYCKKIRDDGGYWNQVDAYIKKYTEAEFSHGICPKCAKKYFAELFEKE
jgi:PAS domain S-box-containing protein